MKPIPRILIVLITTTVICQLCVSVINKGYRLFNKRFTELFEKNTAYDVLFLGSSRTFDHVNPEIIDSICQVNSYNAGIDGANLFEFTTAFDAYLENHPSPRLVVLNIDLTSLGHNYFFNQNQYYPYTDNKVIRNTLAKTGHYNMLYRLFPFLVITAYDNLTKGNAINGLVFKGADHLPGASRWYKGYGTNGDKYIISPDSSHLIQELKISADGKQNLHNIINRCKEKSIQLVFTYAPEYNFGLQKHISNANEIFGFIQETATKNNIPFFRYDSSAICRNPKLFANIGHLNTQGATAYSLLLASQLKSFTVK